ncbi:U5 small nuclear ribonucleoprotein TSSC4 [Phlebotomus argentipes]|uniref:U5 small nuclear ribonucleoprotein TSSC4 n=1 Tax=Phlebotomus argentipes TaxID=94469 RepID=UPI0028932CB8|nr:U5 small nuclear ribonucleoprotein TSSC4 [Phlebotomus argentipes]
MENPGGSHFEDRRKALFDSLNTAERAIKGTSLEQSDSHERSRLSLERPKVDRRNESKQVMKFRGRESIFKRPEAPISQCLRPRQRPDYQVHPDKWTKYSLDDVDTSERTNTAAAFAFLAECEQRRRDEESQEDKEGPEKIVFKKSAKLKKVAEKSEDTATFRASKVVMPEYVIGQPTKREKKKTPSRSSQREKEMKLDHLLEEEDE